jgi:hypothetical protein
MRATIVLLGLFCATSAFPADEKTPPSRGKRLYEQSYYISPQDCEARGVCDLKEVGFRIVRFELSRELEGSVEKEYGSTIYASYETLTHDTLEKYVFVQYVRGCYFQINEMGGVATRRFLPIEHNGKKVPFCFPRWVIDREADDPVYSSDVETPSRFHYAQWADEGGAYQFPSPENMRYYRDKKPLIPKMGIYDQPDTAFVRRWDSGRMLANNTLLEFRTCLYLEKDVPRAFDEAKDKMPEPLACYEWKSTFIYDPVKKIVVEGGAIEQCFVDDIDQRKETPKTEPRSTAHDLASVKPTDVTPPTEKKE